MDILNGILQPNSLVIFNQLQASPNDVHKHAGEGSIGIDLTYGLTFKIRPSESRKGASSTTETKLAVNC